MKGLYFGRISDIDTDAGQVKVAYQSPYKTVSEWMPLLAFEYDMPEIGAYTAVIIDEWNDGVCLGKIYSNEQKPQVSDRYYKKIGNAIITAKGDNFKIQAGGGYIEFSNGIIKIHGIKTVIDNYDGACNHD